MIVKVSRTFSHAPETIWDVVSDPTKDPLWVNTVPHVKHIAGKLGQAGSMYQFTQVIKERSAEGTIQITTRNQHGLEFRVEDPFRVSTISYHIAPTKKGCRLTQVSAPRWKRKMGPDLVVRYMVKKQLRKQMKSLSQHLEKQAN